MASATASPVLTHRCPCHARCLPCPCPLVCPAGTILYAGARYRAISKFALVVLRERNPSRQVSTAHLPALAPWPCLPGYVGAALAATGLLLHKQCSVLMQAAFPAATN
jgi:hypothetical protein